MKPKNYTPYSGVDDKAHLSDGGGGRKKYPTNPNAVYGGVDPKSATHGSGKAGHAKPGGRAKRSKVISGRRGEGPGY